DESVPVRYLHWLGGVLHGDLGTSAVTGRSISAEIQRRLPLTPPLPPPPHGIALAGGPAIRGRRAGLAHPHAPPPPPPAGPRAPDRALLSVVSLGLAIPNFWLATMLVAIFAVQLGWFPAIGYVGPTESVPEWLRHIALPVITLAVFPAAEVARQVRTGLVGVLGRDYIRAAR